MLGFKCILSCTDMVTVPPPYLHVCDFWTLLSFKYIMITGGGGPKYDQEILEQPLNARTDKVSMAVIKETRNR